MTMRITAASVLMATLIATPATAHADCGDPGQDPCTGPFHVAPSCICASQLHRLFKIAKSYAEPTQYLLAG
jgi:hypothetical protein